MRILSDNQQQAIEKLNHLKVGALFMGCGTGKTQTAVCLINSVSSITKVLWVCPKRTIDTVKDELNKCDLIYPADFVGVESIGMSDRIYLETLDKVDKRTFLVVDESIKIKNIDALRTRRLLDISRRCEYKIILNGTPITKNVLDIYAQMEFLSPKILNMTYREFEYTYCVIKKLKKGKRVLKTWISDFYNLDHLMSIIEPYVYECSLDLSLDKHYYNINWAMDLYEADGYLELKTRLLNSVIHDDKTILSIFNKLQHYYCVCSEKFEKLNELVDDKTIIFCKFIKSRLELERRYPNTLILTYGKSSFGLNLQKYNKIIYFDKTFDYAFREQSEARIYRTGQQHDCTYINLTGDVGLEKMIDLCIEKKLSLVDAFKEFGNNLEKL